MRLHTAVLVLVAAAATAATALATPTQRDPLALTLTESDFPSGARVTRDRTPASGLRAFRVRRLKSADYLATFKAGGTVDTAIGPLDKEWQVQGNVFTAPNEAGAKRIYDLGKRARNGFFSDVLTSRRQILRLPSYGEQQEGFATTHPSRGWHAVLLVRKNTVVWSILVVKIPRQWNASRAQVIEQLKTYAAKQKTRVGRG